MPCSMDSVDDPAAVRKPIYADWPDTVAPRALGRPTRLLALVRRATVSLVALNVVAVVALAGRTWLAARTATLAVKPAPAMPTTVRVAVLAPEVVVSGLRYSAAVKEVGRAELSFRVGGTIEDFHRLSGPGGRQRPIHAGDRVAKGTALAWLDTADHRRESAVAAEKLAIAQARLAQLETQSGLAQIELHRTEQLVDRGAATDAELDTARSRQLSMAAAVAGARRDVESARIGLEQAEANLAYCTLVSPIDEGTVAERYIDAGERVAANEPVFLILDLSSVVIAFGVPDTLVSRLALGQEMEVTCEALPGQQLRGVIHKIGSAADPHTHTYAVEVRIDEPQGLRPGMIATVLLEREVRAHLLPLTAIVPRTDTGAYDVFRVTEEGDQTVARRVPVEFDDVVDNRVTIKVGEKASLRPGDRIIATGTHRLYDGQPVAVED
ncbi:MAG TPA: efflux RND transporter periplasmic adaptor subunit [Pirellulales bacterium]|nr:efflux RND transporter periplasmic adaptor subunit [Pirellulales bacterium]